jgi:hypothetical protein
MYIYIYSPTILLCHLFPQDVAPYILQLPYDGHYVIDIKDT